MNKYLRKVVSFVLIISVLLAAMVVTPVSATPELALLVTPTGLDFGPVQVGVTSPVQQVTITNVGTSPITNIQIAGGAPLNPTFGASQDVQGQTLAPGESRHISYSFTPTVAGVVTTTSDFSLNSQSFSVTLTGTGVDPQFLVTPTGQDFGPVQVGVTSPVQQVTITNVGTTPITNIQIAGGAPINTAFGAWQDVQGQTLAPGESRHISYNFTPTMAGVVTTTSDFSLNSQSFSVTLTGTGITSPIPGALLVTPTGLDFGPVQVGVTSPVQQVTITNVGTSPITNIQIAGGAPLNPTFGASQDVQGQTLAPGESRYISYSFTPTVAGVVTTTSDFSLNSQSFSVTLTGTGVDPQFLVTPTGQDFGPVQVGVTSPVQQVTITNVGTTPITNIQIAGGAPINTAFGAWQDVQGQTLAPGESRHISYTFTPTMAGVVTTSSDFTLNGQLFSVALTGTGISGEGPGPINPEVGGYIYPANKFLILVPFISLAVAFLTGAILIFKRRRIQN